MPILGLLGSDGLCSEITPREPCDNVVHKIDLKTVQYEQIHGRGDVPAPRVGHVAAAIAGQIYIFGGVSTAATSIQTPMY